MKQISCIFLLIILISCQDKKAETETAEKLISKSITVAGGKKFDHSTIDFDFRDKHYHALRNNGEFKLVRTFKDSIRKVADYLTNKGFERHINNKKIVVADSMIPRYSASVNSVHYFSVLPYGLNVPAVKKELLEKLTIKGKPYHKVKITFNQEGGGEDFQDVFVYWIDTETYKIAYLAYSYEEADGIGLRFREAYNERYVNGLRFVDYNNYKPQTNTVSVTDLDTLFEKDELTLLSKIELKNINVD